MAARTAQQQDRPTGAHWVPPIYAVLLYSIPMLAPALPWWCLLAIGGAVALFGGMAAAAHYSPGVYGETFTAWVRACVAAAGSGSAAWLALAQTVGGPLGLLNGTPMWQWLVLGMLVIGGWWSALAWRSEFAARAIDSTRTNGPPPAAPEALPAGGDPKVAEYVGILYRAGVTGIHVLKVTPSRSGAVEEVLLESAPAPAGSGRKSAKFSTLVAAMPDVVVEASRTLERTRGIDGLGEHDVQAVRGHKAHTFSMLVTLRQETDRMIAYRLREVPRKATDLLWLGYYSNDQDILLPMFHPEQGATHGTILAKSGAGKGNLMNVKIAELTACEEGEVWLGATDKLIQLAYKWLGPWIEGTTDRPMIDYIAGESQTDVLKMLADALQFAELSNTQIGRLPVRPYGPGKGVLTIYLDESSEIMENKETIKVFDGRVLTASAIWALLKQLSRTAMVACFDASQYSMIPTQGAKGGKSRRNGGIGICGRVRNSSDMGRVMPGMPAHVNPTKIPLNEFFFQTDTGLEDQVALRGRPAAMFREDHITPVAINNTKWRNGLDPKITSKLEHYGDRWSSARLPQLAGLARDEGFRWPGDDWTEGAPVVDPVAEPDAPAPASSPVPVLVLAPARQETDVPASDFPDLPDLPDDAVPSEWDDPGFDVWRLFDRDQVGERAAAPVDGPLQGLPTTDGIQAAVQRLNRQYAERARRQGGLEEPLGSIVRALAHPKAPQDWVTTETLAGVLGRFPADADKETRETESAKLGLELQRQTGMTSEDIPRPVLREWERQRAAAAGESTAGPFEVRRRKGWQVSKLREAAERLRQEQRGA